MYTKSNYRNNDDIIIPENYRGNAFSDVMTEEISSQEEYEEATEKTHEETAVVLQKKEPAEEKPHQNSFLASFLPPKVSKPSGILNNVGLEELLIIGVLILLSQSDSDDDILLLLFLLLFYK